MKRTLAAVGATAAVFAGLISIAPTASATSYCSTSVAVTRNGYYTHVPATSGGSTSCLLGKGSTGAAVEELQLALSICSGLDTGGIDGIYGDKTVAAVRTLQSWYGLEKDGVYGPNTRDWVSWRWYAGVDATCAHL